LTAPGVPGATTWPVVGFTAGVAPVAPEPPAPFEPFEPPDPSDPPAPLPPSTKVVVEPATSPAELSATILQL
jgi:hypothetical protein